MNRIHTRKVRKGFTLVELLVVVLILAILMAVALPLYLGAIANSEKRTARANMQTIANAEQSYKLTNSAHAYTADLTLLTDINPNKLTDPKKVIIGPGTRNYVVVIGAGNCNDVNGNQVTVPDGSFQVASSEPGDGCFVPGVTSE